MISLLCRFYSKVDILARRTHSCLICPIKVLRIYTYTARCYVYTRIQQRHTIQQYKICPIIVSEANVKEALPKVDSLLESDFHFRAGRFRVSPGILVD